LFLNKEEIVMKIQLTRSIVKSVMGFGVLAAVVGCGSQQQSDDTYSSSLLGVSGSGPHEVCASDVNVRSASNLDTILFVSNQGERVTPQGKKTTFLNRVFQLVKFEDRGGFLGYVADDFLCKSGTVNLGEASIEINMSTNRLAFYRGNTVIRSWNVATARAGKVTPTGNFKVQIKETCPPYFGSLGDKNVPGCSSANPLGTRALWFHQGTIYGLHGTSEPGLIADGTTADQRRLSAGCIRNTNANIEWLYNQVKVGTPIRIKW
jgi:hypothetical protein